MRLESTPYLLVITGLLVGVGLIFIFGIAFTTTEPIVKTIDNDSEMPQEKEDDNVEINDNEMSPDEQSVEQLKFRDIFLSYNESQYLTLDIGLISEDEYSRSAAVKRINEAIRTCSHKAIHLLYGLGSMQIAIDGLIDSDRTCHFFLMYDIEMGGQILECRVPTFVLARWESWMNDTAPSIMKIKGYCSSPFIRNDSGG